MVGQEQLNEDDDGSEDGVDDFSDLSSEGGSQGDDNALPKDETVDLDRITEMVNKLDAILKLLFDHFDQQLSFSSTSTSPSLPSTPAISSPPLSPTSVLATSPSPSTPLPTPQIDSHAQQLAQFHTLLAIFTRTILCTFKSRYTQFLLFWFASRDAAFTDLFLGELVAHALLEPAEPEIARTAAATQAVFLIFCFRWRDLVEGSDNGDPEREREQDTLAGLPKKMWMAELNIVRRVVACPLQPLKVLLPFLSVYVSAN